MIHLSISSLRFSYYLQPFKTKIFKCGTDLRAHCYIPQTQLNRELFLKRFEPHCNYKKTKSNLVVILIWFLISPINSFPFMEGFSGLVVRATASHFWGQEFESMSAHLMTSGKSCSTLFGKSWVFSGFSGFLPQGSWQGGLGKIVRKNKDNKTDCKRK